MDNNNIQNFCNKIDDIKTIQEHKRIILSFNNNQFDRNEAISAFMTFQLSHPDYMLAKVVGSVVSQNCNTTIFNLSDSDLVLNLDLQLLYLTGKCLMQNTQDYINSIRNNNI